MLAGAWTRFDKPSLMVHIQHMDNPDDIAATITGSCLAMRVRLIDRVVTQLYAKHVSEHGVSVPQASLLAAIVRNPNVRAIDLASALAFDRSTLSRNIDKLVKRDLISVAKGRGRSRHLKATETGRSLLQALGPSWEKAQQEAEQLLGDHAASVLELARTLT